MRLSRPESAIVAGIAIILISIIVPAIRGLQIQRHLRMVQADMQALIEASRLFHAEYGIWPSQFVVESGDYRYGQDLPNREFMNVLRAIAGPGNRNDSVNPNHVVFIEFGPHRPGASGLNEQGDILDPWGIPYQIVLDTDLNTVCDIPDSLHGAGIPYGIVIWSCGPDRLSDTRDDILSWK